MEGFIDASYLDLLPRRLDSAQMAACIQQGNTVVAAGAGSGKTQTLSSRFAYLVLSCGIEAPRILTLTFTKKAAAEMRQRIYQTLEYFAEDETYNRALPDGSFIDGKTRESLVSRARVALDSFHMAHIQTLDSYCASVLRTGAHFFGLSDDFATGDINSKTQITQSALPFILEHGDAISGIFTDQSIQDFASGTFAAIVEEHTSLATEPGYFAAFLPKQIKAVATGIKKAVGDLQDAVAPLEDAVAGTKGKDADAMRQALSRQMPDVSISEEDVSDAGNVDALMNCVRQIECLLSWAKAIGDVKAPRGTGQFVAAFRPRKSSGADITPIDILAAASSFIHDLPRTKMVLQLLDDFTQDINAKKRKSGHLTFNDVSQMAMKTLLTVPDILVQESTAYDKIMIDEFQDNNAANRDLLFLLSLSPDAMPLPQSIYQSWQRGDDISRELLPLISRDKLFFVGDEKQSIYRFRGADVSVFNRLKEDLCGNGGSLTMATNYRSSHELLKSFNILFGGDGDREEYIFRLRQNTTGKSYEILSHDENGESEKYVFNMLDKAKPYEASYTASAQAPKNAPLPELDQNNIAMHVAILRRDDEYTESTKAIGSDRLLGAEDQKAYYIASRIKALHQDGIDYKDIAVLDRKRTHRKELLYWLRSFGIPFTVDQEARLFEDAVVNDVYNFLKLVSYPSDRNALAAYMASPLVGLNTEEVIAVMSSLLQTERDANTKQNAEDVRSIQTERDAQTEHSAQAKQNRSSVSHIIVDITEHSTWETEVSGILSPASYEKYVNGMNFYRTERSACLKRPLTATLDRLWYDCGMHYTTMDNPALAMQYDMLFALCCQIDASGGGIVLLTDSLAAIKKKERSIAQSKDDSDIDLSSIEYPLEDMDAVHVMTIYASKGLEFGHVFALGVFDMSNDPRQGDWQCDEMGVTFRPPAKNTDNYFYLLTRDRIINEKETEDRRVLYVAVTRAISSITIVADIIINKTPLDSKTECSLMLAPFLESYSQSNEFSDPDTDTQNLLPNTYQAGSAFDVVIISPVAETERTRSPQDSANDLTVSRNAGDEANIPSRIASLLAAYNSAERVPRAFVSAPPESPSLIAAHMDGEPPAISAQNTPECYDKVTPLSAHEDNTTEQDFCQVSDSVRSLLSPAHLGTLMHSVLERCASRDLAVGPANDGTYRTMDNASMRILSELKKSDEDVVYSSLDALEKSYLESALYKDVADAKEHGRLVRTEWPFMMNSQGTIMKGKADLLYEDASGTLVIVDYKSDRVIDPEHHKAQLMVYKKAASVFGYDDSRIKCVLCYLNHGMQLVSVD